MNNNIVLDPIDGRASFGGKAIVYEIDGVKYLSSYGTIVASIKDHELRRHWPGWSLTTGRHVKAFACEFGVYGWADIDKKAWDRMEVIEV